MLEQYYLLGETNSKLLSWLLRKTCEPVITHIGAGHKGGAVASQEEHDLRHLVRLAKTLGRSAVQKLSDEKV